jgi:acetyl-CoA acetyltransferase
VILSYANQAGEDNRNVARMAVLLAGLPVGRTGTTVNQVCGSGFNAVSLAARSIRAGDCNMMIPGGVASMTRALLVMPKVDKPFARTAEIRDATISWRFVNPRMHDLYGTDAIP